MDEICLKLQDYPSDDLIEELQNRNYNIANHAEDHDIENEFFHRFGAGVLDLEMVENLVYSLYDDVIEWFRKHRDHHSIAESEFIEDIHLNDFFERIIKKHV